MKLTHYIKILPRGTWPTYFVWELHECGGDSWAKYDHFLKEGFSFTKDGAIKAGTKAHERRKKQIARANAVERIDLE